MTALTGSATGVAVRHRPHAVTVDAGTDTVRLGLPDGELVEFPTPVAATGPARARARARANWTAAIVDASRDAMRRRSR